MLRFPEHRTPWLTAGCLFFNTRIEHLNQKASTFSKRQLYLFEDFPNSLNMSLRVQKRFWGSKKIWMPTPAVHSV